MHVSIPVDQSVEFIQMTEVNPLLSKCQIKVCYVSDEPNRNGTVINKLTATEMGKKLPGSPIVGYYNQETKDFEEHNRELVINEETFALVDMTKAYGFVPTNARVWFQKFLDDDQIEREYLVTEGYLWTDIYPESKRIIDKGNNHSMELNRDSMKGYWSGNFDSDERFFIINEAIIEKLCILGENYEPCFEGSQIKAQFSLIDEFTKLKESMYSMIAKIEAENEGGSGMSNENEKSIQDSELENDYKAKEPEEEEKEKDNSDKKETEKTEKDSEKKEEDKKKDSSGKYNLEEVTEYIELKSQYEELSTKYANLEQQIASLNAELKPLKTFKCNREREDKQAMIDSFIVLSDEDKKDVQDNIDTYSLDDIEAKLAVLCVRKKVNFNLEDQNDNPNMTFNLQGATNHDDAPAWIKEVRQVASSMN